MPADDFQLSTNPTKVIDIVGYRESKYLRARFNLAVYSTRQEGNVISVTNRDWPTAWDWLRGESVPSGLIEQILRAALKEGTIHVRL